MGAASHRCGQENEAEPSRVLQPRGAACSCSMSRPTASTCRLEQLESSLDPYPGTTDRCMLAAVHLPDATRSSTETATEASSRDPRFEIRCRCTIRRETARKKGP